LLDRVDFCAQFAQLQEPDVIYLCKDLEQIDLPDSGLDDGRLKAHIQWLYENIDAVNADITAAIDAAPGIQHSWLPIAIQHLAGLGAIVVTEEVNHG
jgi:hypothetical protein